MSSDRNIETIDAVKREIKELEARCKHELIDIYNSPLDAPNVGLEQTKEKTLCYTLGLGTEIQNSNTPITMDDNLLTSQFLKEIQDKTNQVKEYTAFMRGSICDIDVEINRLKAQITAAQEAKSRPKTHKSEVQLQHVNRAKEHFQFMKNELHGLIHSVFPESDSMVFDVLGELMNQHLNETSNDYIPITKDTFDVIKLLQDMKIVTINPYNNNEVKLSI